MREVAERARRLELSGVGKLLGKKSRKGGSVGGKLEWKQEVWEATDRHAD